MRPLDHHGLVDASLVQVETPGNGTPRYTMLGVIREYAVEQLRAAEESEQYQQRHAAYYALLAERAEQNGPDQATRETQLEQESANGRAAFALGVWAGPCGTGPAAGNMVWIVLDETWSDGRGKHLAGKDA